MHIAVTALPIESAEDTAYETDTDELGRFVVPTLSPGKYTIGASSPTVTAGWANVDLTGTTVPVTITVGDGQPRIFKGVVHGVSVEKSHVLIGRWDAKRASALFSVPVRNGKWAFAAPMDGTYAMQAIAPGAESQTATPPADLTLERKFSEVPKTVPQWIAKNAIPLKTVSAGSGFDDMLPLQRIVGDARIVALGEATHGTREFFQFKHRMLEFLVANMGFDVFAIEASFPDALAVNDYVLHGTGDPARALAGMQFWTWNTEEVLALIKWMRAWNEDPHHTRKLRFYGFDMQHPEASAEILRRYFEKNDESALPLLKANALDEIDKRLTNAPPIVRYQTTLLRQDKTTRDIAMAQNIRWLMEHEPKGTKMVVWAHNGHVSTEKLMFANGRNMGVELRSMFGKDYVVFGAAFNAGSFQAVSQRGRQGLNEHKVVALDPGTFDRTLADSGPPMFVLDLRRATGVVKQWLDSPLKTRTIGAVYNDDNPKAYVQTVHPSRSFDALYFVRDTSSAIPVGGRRAPVPQSPGAAAAVNLDFAHGVDGWTFTDAAKSAGFELVATSEGCVVAPCARMSRSGEGADFGAFFQRIDATPHRGKKIRFHAKVRSNLTGDESSARLWVRVDRPDGVGFFDNMGDRAPKSLAEWTDLEISGDVAQDAVAISIGGLFIGSGTAWFDEATFDVVP